MLGGMFIFAAVDTMAKFLTTELHPIQIVWSRQLGLLLGVIVMLFLRGPKILRTKAPGLQVLRGTVAAGSAALFIFAVAHVPLADAVAVSFVAPFMVTILAALILREKVGMRRWIAVSLGFLGTMIVIRPGLGVIHPAVFLVVIAAAFFACRQIISRALSSSDKTSTTVAYTAIVSLAILSLPLPFVWTWDLSAQTIKLLVAMAVLALVAETLVIRALELAEAVVIAPLHYSMILWGTFYGWLVFSDLPDFWTWIGTAIIIATGIYTINRERIVARNKRMKKQP